MAFYPVFKNLDTSFVNLSALVRYLRRRQFTGRMRIELNSYEADVVFTEDNKLLVREVDKLLDRKAEGAEAFQRVLIRAREAGGTISVYQQVEEGGETVAVNNKPKAAVAAVSNLTAPGQVTSRDVISQTARQASREPQNGIGARRPIVHPPTKPDPTERSDNPHFPMFPFDLRSSVQERARTMPLTTEDNQLLLSLLGELLGTIDNKLAASRLDFPAAFAKARQEVTSDYPFMDPSISIFQYQNGKVDLSTQISPKLLVSSILEIVGMILRKLKTTPKFVNVYFELGRELNTLVESRRTNYLRFAILPHLSQVL